MSNESSEIEECVGRLIACTLSRILHATPLIIGNIFKIFILPDIDHMAAYSKTTKIQRARSQQKIVYFFLN